MDENQQNSAEKPNPTNHPIERAVRMRLRKQIAVPSEEYYAAIGRLAGWGMFSRSIVSVAIFGDEDGYLEANYYSATGEVMFVQGAVWRMQANGEMGYDFNS